MNSKPLVVLATALLLVASVAPTVAATGDLSVAVDQEAGGEATVTVTENGTAVENASVSVVAVNATYAGEGNETTDADGTVTLPAPEENVTVDVTAEYENETATTTADLVAATENGTSEDEAFGARVSAFVRSLLNGTEDQRRIGRLIASWVVENNPGNAPDHAGPPDDAGPPASAGSGAADSGGNETDGNATVQTGPGNGQAGGNGNGNGPPENPGANGNGEAKGNGR